RARPRSGGFRPAQRSAGSHRRDRRATDWPRSDRHRSGRRPAAWPRPDRRRSAMRPRGAHRAGPRFPGRRRRGSRRSDRRRAGRRDAGPRLTGPDHADPGRAGRAAHSGPPARSSPGHPQFRLIGLPFACSLASALMLMFLPLITMLPDLAIEMLESPHFRKIWSGDLMNTFFLPASIVMWSSSALMSTFFLAVTTTLVLPALMFRSLLAVWSFISLSALTSTLRFLASIETSRSAAFISMFQSA